MKSVVSVERLAKRFGDHEVLRDISFEVMHGSVTVILGPSGSGKTTILRSLNALEVPDSGTIRIADVSVNFAELQRNRRGETTSGAERQLRELRAQSGMVFQAHNLFPHRTVLQNVTDGPVLAHGASLDAATSAATDLLAKVGLADQADKFPAQLSGGQQQRVGIARALALSPELVLFDEPTSSLDPELVGDVLGVMKDLAHEGRTMVVVTHEIRFARQVADQVLFIDNGLIVEQGRPADVIGNPSQPRTQSFLKRVLDPI